MAEAQAGKPASSNPGKRPAEMAPPAAPPTKSAKTVDKKEKNDPKDEDPGKTSPATKPESPDETSPGETEVNSSTHRAAHARLVRRMERLPVAEFPNMSRLWNGSRKETRYISNYFRYFWIISPRSDNFYHIF